MPDCPLFIIERLVTDIMSTGTSADDSKNERSKQEGLWKVIPALLVWILAGVLHYFMTRLSFKLIIQVSGKTCSCIPLIFTTAEVVISRILIKTCKTEKKSELEGAVILWLSHVALTFTVNTMLSFPETGSGIAILLFEPVVNICLSVTCVGMSFRIYQLMFVAVITVGATGFSTLTSPFKNNYHYTVLVLAVLVLLCIRNISIKHTHEEKEYFILRSKTVTLVVLLFGLSVLLFPAFLSHFTYFYVLLTAFLSWMLYVIFLYISWTILLKYYSLISLSVLSGLQQLIAINVMDFTSRSFKYVHTWLFFMILIIGLVGYIKDATTYPVTYKQTVSSNDMYTRLEFVIFLACTVGILLYIIPPHVSSRDVNNLKYVGLDSLLHWLL